MTGRYPGVHDWYFTFGQSQIHSCKGVTLDRDSVVKITGTNEQARNKMFELFGPKWGMQYHADEFNAQCFPRGVVLEFDVTEARHEQDA